jgi:hypothetical protein
MELQDMTREQQARDEALGKANLSPVDEAKLDALRPESQQEITAKADDMAARYIKSGRVRAEVDGKSYVIDSVESYKEFVSASIDREFSAQAEVVAEVDSRSKVELVTSINGTQWESLNEGLREGFKAKSDDHKVVAEYLKARDRVENGGLKGDAYSIALEQNAKALDNVLGLSDERLSAIENDLKDLEIRNRGYSAEQEEAVDRRVGASLEVPPPPSIKGDKSPAPEFSKDDDGRTVANTKMTVGEDYEGRSGTVAAGTELNVEMRKVEGADPSYNQMTVRDADGAVAWQGYVKVDRDPKGNVSGMEYSTDGENWTKLDSAKYGYVAEADHQLTQKLERSGLDAELQKAVGGAAGDVSHNRGGDEGGVREPRVPAGVGGPSAAHAR